MSKKHNYSQIINKIGEDIISSDRFQDARQITHHGTENVAEHSLRVAEQACEIALLLKKHGVELDYDKSGKLTRMVLKETAGISTEYIILY